MVPDLVERQTVRLGPSQEQLDPSRYYSTREWRHRGPGHVRLRLASQLDDGRPTGHLRSAAHDAVVADDDVERLDDDDGPAIAYDDAATHGHVAANDATGDDAAVDAKPSDVVGHVRTTSQRNAVADAEPDGHAIAYVVADDVAWHAAAARHDADVGTANGYGAVAAPTTADVSHSTKPAI